MRVEKSRAENCRSRRKFAKERRRRRKFEGRGGLAMEAAPRRHNITILERPAGARGGRHRGRVAGLARSPHAALSPGDDGVGFSRPRRGVTERRRDAGRLRAAPAPLRLSPLSPFLSLSLSLSFAGKWFAPSVFQRWLSSMSSVLLVLVIMLFVQVSRRVSPEGFLWKHIVL